MFNGRRQRSRDGTSRMTRECQVRFCGRLGVKFPEPTRHFIGGWYATSFSSKLEKKVPVKWASKWGVEGDRPWRQIAGPPMSPEALRLATLPLDPKVEVSLKRANRVPLNPDALFQRKTSPLNILGGYRFDAAPNLGSLAQSVASTESRLALDVIEDAPMLSPDIDVDPFIIPEFLRRVVYNGAGRYAASLAGYSPGAGRAVPIPA
jgi:hypothetical protein